MQNMEKPTSSNKNLILAGVLVIVIAGAIVAGVSVNNRNKENASVATNSSSSTNTTDSTSKQDVMKKEDSAMTNEGVMKKDDSIASKAGTYTNYSSDLVKTADKNNVVLFFNASWCPTCRSAVKNINENLSSIPSNLTILSADYDKEIALRQKYGVTTQHTFVKVDKDGNLIKKTSGLDTVSEISNFAK